MPDIVLLLGANFAAVIIMMLTLWLASIPLGDVSFIDSFWAFGFILVGCVTSRLFPFGGLHQTALLALVGIWGLRLGLYLLWRWRHEGPDGRYLSMIKNARGPLHLYTLKTVFLLQGIIMWVVSLPLQLGQFDADTGFGTRALAGGALSAIGIVFESLGDFQLARFKADPANKGKVLDHGLWRYTRHPNYFGDLCFWWGCYLIASEAPWGWASVVGPILMTFLLIKWSGVALLERRLTRSRPAYADYVRRTSALIPWPPRG